MTEEADDGKQDVALDSCSDEDDLLPPEEAHNSASDYGLPSSERYVVFMDSSGSNFLSGPCVCAKCIAFLCLHIFQNQTTV